MAFKPSTVWLSDQLIGGCLVSHRFPVVTHCRATCAAGRALLEAFGRRRGAAETSSPFVM
ncbi:hypothetical protein F3Y22_tig00110429pilonHSYRG00372 [Hibiscus syriacus]|uniref:Uncharacterized protein n=1 Tax=Hibiscus syriacus TaxID=106335 RepID=A0A6A3AN34_HIBSY|nr:hypothetical protein F3Y22_tig00110429pilonHSYRG00372 [Hibiscus syriacus]